MAENPYPRFDPQHYAWAKAEARRNRDDALRAEGHAAGRIEGYADALTEIMGRAWPVEMEVCPGCTTIIDIDAESCGCEYPPRRVSKTFYLLSETQLLRAIERHPEDKT